MQDDRSDLIQDKELIKKVREDELTPDDRQALMYILKSTSSSKAKWNSIMIFVLSVVALAYAIVVDIIRLVD